MAEFDAVIFDVDGVLADSEPLHAWAWQQILTKYGIDAEPEEIDKFVGIPCEVMLEYFQAKAGGSLPDAAIHDKRALFDEVMPGRLKPIEGAPAVVRELHRRGVPLAAASNSPSDRVRDMLTAIGVWEYFQAASGIDEVPEGKPAPDVYLLAASRLGVEPRRCLAVEDSPTGVRAAAAAGMTVWGYVNHHFSSEALGEAGAHLTIDALSRMLDIL